MSTVLKNDTMIKALRKEPVPYTPVWMMRQAGRYLPEYRATRARAGDFLSLCKNPELACEVTLQPLERFPLDAAILFSDILTIPDALGLGLYFETGEGPKFRDPCRDLKAVEAVVSIKEDDMLAELQYVFDAVKVIRQALNGRVPLIGFSGSPWTLATYMVEGSGTKDFRRVKGMMYREPETMHKLLSKLAQSVTAYLIEQIKAGAQVVQVFDTWGGVLNPKTYQSFSLDYMNQIVRGIRQFDEQIPIILFTKGAGLWLESLAESGATCVGLDWSVNIGDAKARIGDKVALQGNIDPSTLYAPDDVIVSEVQQVLSQFGQGSGHVFNLGHGIHLDVDPEKAKLLIESVHEHSRQYHDL